MESGDTLVPAGAVLAVRPYPGRRTVYDLTIAHEAHTFIVSGYVVHNKAQGQHGLSMTVPPGFPNDTFPIMTTSGEHVEVTPKNEVNNSRNFTWNGNANINNGTDQAEFESMLSRALKGIR